MNNYSDIINDLCHLIEIKSISSSDDPDYIYGKETEKALDYILEMCQRFGFRTVKKDTYAFAEVGEGNEIIGILCHLDVVPGGSGWRYDPFKCTIENGRIYGRGTLDDKGPTIACLYAIKNLIEKTELSKRIRIIFGQCEETGDWKDIEDYKSYEELPSYGFTPDGDFPAICAEKGLMVALIKMKISSSGLLEISGGHAPNMVPDKAYAKTLSNTYYADGHSNHGCAPWNGVNAITSIVSYIVQKEGLSSSPFCEMYHNLFVSPYGEQIGCKYHDDESGDFSLNPGLIEVKEDEIHLYLDMRYPVTYNYDEVKEHLSNALQAYDATVEFIHHQPPLFSDKIVTEALLDAYQTHTGDYSPPIAIGGGTYARSMPGIVAFGPNFPGHENNEHKADEYILIDDFKKLLKIYESAIENLLKI